MKNEVKDQQDRAQRLSEEFENVKKAQEDGLLELAKLTAGASETQTAAQKKSFLTTPIFFS